MGVRKERGRWEIIADILMVFLVEIKPKKTRIMQRAGLNWRNLQKYFDLLIEENFVAKCNSSEMESYELTEKGRELLKKLKGVKELLQ